MCVHALKSEKSKLVELLACYLSHTFNQELHGIGNINSSSEPRSFRNNELPEVKRVVFIPFFWGSHRLQNVSRGPFRSIKD